MSTIELRNDFHSLIDSINNDVILTRFYTLMKRFKESKQGQLWNALSADEQDELLQSDMESIDEDQIISADEVRKKHSKWL